MRKFILLLLKSLVLTVITTFLSLQILKFNPEYDTALLSSIKLKYEKLKNISGKKIVIIGGSNGTFGIDSENIENQLEIPVVNMSVSAGVGMSYYTQFIKNELNEGDIVILTPEYNTLNKDSWYGMKGNAVPKIITYIPSKLPILLDDLKLFEHTFSGYFRSVKACWEEFPFEKKEGPVTAYKVESFYKDNIKDVFLTGHYKKPHEKVNLTMNPNIVAFEEMKEVKKIFDQKGVKFYITPPAALKDKFYKKEAIEYIKFLSKNSGIPVLNNNQSYLFDRKYMLDTEYHLNVEGRKIRTNMLIEDIKSAEKKLYTKKLKRKIILSYDNSINIPLKEFHNRYNFKKNIDSLPLKVNFKCANDGQWNFITTKLNGNKYLNNLIKFKVNGDLDLIEDLQFKGLSNYKFDDITKISNREYILCKKLVNVKIHKDNFTLLGLTTSKEQNLSGLSFDLLEAKIYGKEFYCNSYDDNAFRKQITIPDKEQVIIVNFANQNQKINLNRFSNLDTEIILDKEKYLFIIKEDKINVFEFYTSNLIAKFNRQKLIFKALSNKSIEIMY